MGKGSASAGTGGMTGATTGTVDGTNKGGNGKDGGRGAGSEGGGVMSSMGMTPGSNLAWIDASKSCVSGS